ncbi:MAG: hypothetical protein ACOYL6_11480 [Bacteriovoracaceae bacterium]
MKYLPLILLLLIFVSLQASAYGTFSPNTSEDSFEAEAEIQDQEQMNEDGQEEIMEANIPAGQTSLDDGSDFAEVDEGATPTSVFQEDLVANRLQDEMTYLNREAETSAPTLNAQTSPGEAASINAKSKIPDLEEKINFRAAAVKRADNLQPDEVDATDLDGDIFK